MMPLALRIISILLILLTNAYSYQFVAQPIEQVGIDRISTLHN